MVGRTQIGGDGSVTEAVKHTTVGGETIGRYGSTSWIYPGDASSITYMGSGDCKAEIRGAGHNGLEATEYRKLTPVLGWGSYNHSGGGVAMGTGNIMPHEFRITDTSGAETNTVTWNINYSAYGDEEGKV